MVYVVISLCIYILLGIGSTIFWAYDGETKQIDWTLSKGCTDHTYEVAILWGLGILFFPFVFTTRVQEIRNRKRMYIKVNFTIKP